MGFSIQYDMQHTSKHFLTWKLRQPSKVNFLGGMLAEFGLGIARYVVSVPPKSILSVFGGVAWIAFHGIVRIVSPWSRVILLTALLTYMLAALLVFLLVAFLT